MVAGDDDGAEAVDDESWADVNAGPFEADPSDAPVVPEADDDVVQDADGDAFQCPRCLSEAKAPSRADMLKHNLTHWPYAPWCPHCVMARRNIDPRFQDRDKLRELSRC